MANQTRSLHSAHWGTFEPVVRDGRLVDVHVRRLRVSLGSCADVVETVHGFGYRARRDGG